MTSLNISDLDRGLVVRTARIPSLAESALSAVAAGVTIGFAVQFVATRPQAIALAFLAAAAGFFYARRTRRFELKITGSEFVAVGKVGDNPGNSRSVPIFDIRWLEYQEDTTGPEIAHHPGGLYAVMNHRSVCLLPDIDEHQTAVVIERIKAKFPGLRTQWTEPSSSGNHFTSLGLKDDSRKS
jgi:hypothetical protein